ncbi:hypothetical protein BDV96DRAFT_606870 [Lophiotrema nucula]|uniref:Rhodopsin domain-containing protein n=1 Tax=Lophiotrema nucula TaxID=690887 RepID=A0A6A5YIM7_9PLEO|nr:hypothetical protein BDV96DRAFT_606870 [Lophiotrema nucula]
MAGTYKPIAGLSPDNQGPALTIVAIVLSATSVLFSSVRYAIGRKRILQFESDDAIFGVALCFGIAASIMSNATVGTGLGRHEDSLSEKQLERYFKLQYTAQILIVLSMASAKMSLVLMFRRIVPVTFAPFTLKILGPVTAVYAILCIFLIAFQCQLPSPWVLNPESCSTNGNVYYATTVFNIITDLLLAGWILPSIWSLQMEQNTRILVMSLFATRVVVSAVDCGRLVYIHRALNSTDITWTSLPWAILDLIVMHLSINHATLPRVHVFLSNLQTGLLVTRLTTNAISTNSKGSKRSPDADDSCETAADGRANSSRWKRWKRSRSGSYERPAPARSRSSRVLNLLKSIDRSNDTQKEGSISESPLRLQPEHGIELSTQIYADADSTASGAGKKHSREDLYQREPVGNGGPLNVLPGERPSRSNSGRLLGRGKKASGNQITINVHKTVETTVEFTGQEKRKAVR